jgi:tRNA-dihydrouridine synthase A
MNFSRQFCVAPMMDWTDRHDRMFLRQFSKHALLYTEMVTSGALLFGDTAYLLQHDLKEQPCALQLGGSDPAQLAQCALLGEQAGYQEINLNVGCPSERVQSGAFGACLMASPKLVADCVHAMQQVTSIPITVKCRLGIDDQDSEEFLVNFVQTVAAGGCKTFIIHARKAILKGLSPKQNREIPPLIYDRVYGIKTRYPELEIIINGGITNFAEVHQHCQFVDGVMLGREAYQNPYILAQVDSLLFNESAPPLSRIEYLEKYLPYVTEQLALGTPLQHITRHLLGLFKGQKGGKQYRRHLSENSYKKTADISVLLDAIAYVD